MRNLILFVLLSSTVSFAGEPQCTTDEGEFETTAQMDVNTGGAAAYLKGATITVRLADGRSSTVPAEKFKVVPRLQQFVVTKLEKTKTISCATNTPRKNRISVLGGYAPNHGFDSSKSGSTLTVETNTGLSAGAQYQRMLNDRWSVGVQGQSNESGALLFGLDF